MSEDSKKAGDKNGQDERELFSPVAVFQSTELERLVKALQLYIRMAGEKMNESEIDDLYGHCIMYCLSRYRCCTRLRLAKQQQLNKLSCQGIRMSLDDPQTEMNTLEAQAVVSRWTKYVTEFMSNLSIEQVEFWRATEQAFELDLDVKFSYCTTAIDAIGGRWDNFFISLMKSLPDYIKVSKNSDFWKLDKRRREIVHDDSWGTLNASGIIILLLSYVLLFYYQVSPVQMNRICDRVQFHHKFFDDEIRSLIKWIKNTAVDSGENAKLLVLARLLGCLNNATLLTLELQCMFNSSYVNCDPARASSAFPRFAAFLLYQKLRDIDDTVLTDEWLRFQFTGEYDSRNVTGLLAKTYIYFRNLTESASTSRPHSDRIKLNGKCVGHSSDYKLPAFKSSPACLPRLNLQRFRVGEVIPKKVTLNSASSSATTVVDDPDEEYQGPSPEELLARKQNNLKMNRTVAKIFKTNRSLTDDQMRRMRIPFVEVDIPDDERITFYEADGKTIIRTTNLRKGGAYHCMCLSYDIQNDEWLIKPDWCYVKGLLLLDESNKGANREVLVGDGCLAQCNAEGRYPFVYKQQRSHLKHDNIHVYLGDIRAQSVGQHYIDHFGELTQDRFGCLRMLHADFIVVFENSKCETIIDHMSREHHCTSSIPSTLSDFYKFTNNSTWKNTTVNTNLYEAFSHFTFDSSEGFLMVADLQGWGFVIPFLDNILYVFTDPVILCDCEPRSLVGNPLINSGTRGMKLFFREVHPECNDICRELGLKRHPEFDGAPN